MSIEITALCGSLRNESLNRKLLHAVLERAPENVEIHRFGLEGIPVYNQDDEDENGIPSPVEAIKSALTRSSGFIIATPEYNNAIPGPLKNALDWMTRPPAERNRVFRGKAVALIGATPGARGTLLAQTAWLPIFRALAMRPWFESSVYAASAGDLFDDDGALSDEQMDARLGRFIQGFSEFAGRTE